MHSFSDALNLIDYTKAEFNLLKVEYTRSTEHKRISSDLPIKIKIFLKNLRSALDFCAHNLHEKFGDLSKPPKTIYFPYAWIGATAKEFDKKVEICLPGIKSLRPDIHELLHSYQYYNSPENIWLPQFMELANEDKYTKLIFQTIDAVDQLVIDTGMSDSKIFIRGEGVLDLGKNAIITSKHGSIKGKQIIHLKNNELKNIEGSVTAEINKHTAIHFESNNEEVIHFLNKIMGGVAKIAAELSNLN